MLGVGFALLRVGIRSQEPVYIGFCNKHFLHIRARLSVFQAGFFLFLQQRCVLGPQAFDGGNLRQPQFVKGFLRCLMKQDRVVQGCKIFGELATLKNPRFPKDFAPKTVKVARLPGYPLNALVSASTQP